MFSRTALVRRPGPLLAAGLVSHIERQEVDQVLAMRQWREYVAALHGTGWETVEVPPADDCPDAVFVEDTVVVYGDLAVITRPGALSRRGETAVVEETVRGLGHRDARAAFAPMRGGPDACAGRYRADAEVIQSFLLGAW